MRCIITKAGSGENTAEVTAGPIRGSLVDKFIRVIHNQEIS